MKLYIDFKKDKADNFNYAIRKINYMTKIPPLLSLRAFEAVARHKNIAKAADELCVTRSAVSQQVKQLEGYFDLVLIDRSNNKIALTHDAQIYAEELTKFFQGVGFATQSLLVAHKSNRVTLNLPTTYAMYWLIPKMQEFQDLYPDIELRIATPQRKVNFDIEDIDLAIDNGERVQEGLSSEFLFYENWLPICTPSYLARVSKGRHRYIEVNDSERQYAWSKWCKEYNEPLPREGQILYVSHTLQAIQAALNGLGLACVPKLFVENELASGRLILPFGDRSTMSISPFYVLSSLKIKDRKEVLIVKKWLLNLVAT